MKKFMLFNQDNKATIELHYGKFTCSILELAGVYFAMPVSEEPVSALEIVDAIA